MVFILRILLGLSLAAYGAYGLISVWAAWQWHRARLSLDPNWTPAVTILKPVRGVDAEAYENFASFCRLDYPSRCLQILFGALDPDDPALELVRRLQTEFPEKEIGIVTGGPDAIRGTNRKVCNLLAMLPQAKHDLLVLCDSDMRVHPDYLRRLVAPFQQGVGGRVSGVGAEEEGAQTFGRSGVQKESDPNPIQNPKSKIQNPTSDPRPPTPVGLVTCPYRGHRARSFAAKLEALGIGADFIPGVLVSRALEGVSFALGSTIALPRAVLEEIGGFEPLLNELADDFRLGNGVFKAGYTVVLSDYVIEDVLGQERFGAMWARRLRWARTVRVCRPAGYAGASIIYGVPLALLFLLASGFALYGWAVFCFILAFRFLTALTLTQGFTGDSNVRRYLWLLPLSDLLSFTLYIVSFCGNRITWRGEQFRLYPGGKMVRIPDKQGETG